MVCIYRVMHRFELIKAIFSLLLLTSGLLLRGEEILLPGEEAATSLLEGKIGDSDVELLIDGTWRIETSLGGVWGSPGPVTPEVPGFSSGFMFNQIPDLTLSLWLRERYFFETSFTEEELFNTYLLGYEGREGEFLRRVRIGNTGTNTDSTPLVEVPDHPDDALGASATMETAASRHELLFRYQRTSRITKEYRGEAESRGDPDLSGSIYPRPPLSAARHRYRCGDRLSGG